MNSPDYSLPLPQTSQKSLAKAWFLLGAIALALAGLFAGLLVHAQRKHNTELFYTSLIIHVDLSVLVWFLAFAGMMWSLFASNRTIPYLNGAAFGCFAVGTLCLPLSAWVGTGEAYINNYVPMITKPVFFLGLSLICTGISLAMVSVFLSDRTDELTFESIWKKSTAHAVQYFGLFSAAMITVISLISLAWANRLIPEIVTGEHYYELLFWGGGHVLQLTHTTLTIVCWFWLASIIGLKLALPPRGLALIQGFSLLVALTAPLGFIFYDITSFEHRQFFTDMMRWGNALAPAIAILTIVWALRNWTSFKREHSALWSALICSLILCIVGGLLGYRIDGSTVTIPAHYHGSIVGVTLAYMGIAYYLLPHFGAAHVTRWKMATLQPILYCIGQLCWIAGMAILGDYGQARKQAALPDAETTFVLIGNILKRSGDGLSLLGGLFFVIVVARALFSNKKKEA